MKHLSFAIFTISIMLSGSASQLCEKHRPQLHFSVPKGWMNDPNGLVYHNKEWHHHYQHYPDAPIHGPMHWGHAVSNNLIDWKHLPIALAPEKEMPDHPGKQGNIFSGSAVVDDTNSAGFGKDALIAIYTRHVPSDVAGQPATEEQCIAYSLDNGRTYTRYTENPVIKNSGADRKKDFRDPKVMRQGDKWVLAVAASDKIEFWDSVNLKAWNFKSSFGGISGSGNGATLGSYGGVWECPDLFSFTVNDQVHWVLLVSINPGAPNKGAATQYFIGKWDGSTFTTTQKDPLWMDWGFDNYAGVTFASATENRVLYLGWMGNWDYGTQVPTGNFRGQNTLPRVLRLDDVAGVGLRLGTRFAKEVEALRIADQIYQMTTAQDLELDKPVVITPTFSTTLMEMEFQFDISALQVKGTVAVCLSNIVKQELCFGFSNDQPAGHDIFIDRGKAGDSSFSGNFYPRAFAARVLKTNEITFHAILDVASIELLVDDGLTAMTALFFPDTPLYKIEVRHQSTNRSSKAKLLKASVRGLKSIQSCPTIPITVTPTDEVCPTCPTQVKCSTPAPSSGSSVTSKSTVAAAGMFVGLLTALT